MTDWHKSSYSGGSNECVEAREHTERIDLRDTKHPDHGHLTFPTPEWTAFLHDLRNEHL